ncbi:MAG: hypothetical protein U0531_03300 [Dehalococcoidia bacterium]
MRPDPQLFRARLAEMGVLSEAEAEALRASIRTEVEQAIRYAEESPLPTEADLLTDVYT